MLSNLSGYPLPHSTTKRIAVHTYTLTYLHTYRLGYFSGIDYYHYQEERSLYLPKSEELVMLIVPSASIHFNITHNRRYRHRGISKEVIKVIFLPIFMLQHRMFFWCTNNLTLTWCYPWLTRIFSRKIILEGDDNRYQRNCSCL